MSSKLSLMTFPNFKDADVHIFLSATWKYSLHRKVLIHNSSTLAQLLTVENAAPAPSIFGAREDCREWLLRLRYPPIEKEHEESGELVAIVSMASNTPFCT